MTKLSYPYISIVVIGYNEAKNLDSTFSAILNCNYPQEKLELIYCDTGSEDISCDVAHKYTNKVFVEINEWPTPGLARNLGLVKAKYEIVHFLDGDIVIDPNYLINATKILKENKVQAVFGRLYEKNKGINTMLLSHWDLKKEGYVNSTGGGGTYLKSSLLNINGYDERIRRGEEGELGDRYINAGNKIWYAEIPMGIHDYGVKSIKNFLQIPYIAGKSAFYNSKLRPENNFFNSQKSISRNNFIQNFSFYACMALIPLYNLPIILYSIVFIGLVCYKIIKNKAYRKLSLFLNEILNGINRFIFFYGQISVFLNIYILRKHRIPAKRIF